MTTKKASPVWLREDKPSVPPSCEHNFEPVTLLYVMMLFAHIKYTGLCQERLFRYDIRKDYRLACLWNRLFDLLREAVEAGKGFGAFVVVLYVAPIGTGFACTVPFPSR